jgi:hypothetical protein
VKAQDLKINDGFTINLTPFFRIRTKILYEKLHLKIILISMNPKETMPRLFLDQGGLLVL